MSKPKAEQAETVYDGATYEAISPGPRKIVLAGMFHKDPKLVQAEKTEAQWDAAVEKFLSQTAS